MAKPNLPTLPKTANSTSQNNAPATKPDLNSAPVTTGTVSLNTPKNLGPDAEISPVKSGGTASVTGGKPNLPPLPSTGSTGASTGKTTASAVTPTGGGTTAGSTAGKPNLPTLPSNGSVTASGVPAGSSQAVTPTGQTTTTGTTTGKPNLPDINAMLAELFKNQASSGGVAAVPVTPTGGTTTTEGSTASKPNLPTLPAAPGGTTPSTGGSGATAVTPVGDTTVAARPTAGKPNLPPLPTVNTGGSSDTGKPGLPNLPAGEKVYFDEVTAPAESTTPSNIKLPSQGVGNTFPVTLPTVTPQAPTGDAGGGTKEPDKGTPEKEAPAVSVPAITNPTFTPIQLPGTGTTTGPAQTSAPTMTAPTFTPVQMQGGVSPSTSPAVPPALTSPTFTPVQMQGVASPGTDPTVAPSLTTPTFNPVQAQAFSAAAMPTAPTADVAAIRSQLEQMQALTNQQNDAKVDYATQQAVNELQRTEADAQAGFKEQAESVALDERQGMDNSALYAQARGDKGGIGQAQYNEIQAAAAQNRLAVQQQQSKLSTDTARQIADLRAQGEFEKADAMLETAQAYLARLTQLEQWAAEYGMSAAQFQAQMAQWQNEFNFAMSEYQTGLSQWNAQMQYQQAQDALANEKWMADFNESVRQWQDQFNYGKEQDALNLEKWNAQMQYQQAQDALANEKWMADFAESARQWQEQFNYGKEQDALNLEKWNAQMQYQQAQDALANQKWEADFNESVRQWQDQFNYGKEQDALNLEKWNAQMQYQQEQDKAYNDRWAAEFGYSKEQDSVSNALKQQNQMASMGEALLSSGVMPSDEQLAAMGITKTQAQQWVIAAQLEAANKAAKEQSNAQGFSTTAELYQALKNSGATTKSSAAAQLEMWGYDSKNYVNDYLNWANGGNQSALGSAQNTAGWADSITYDALANSRANGATDADMVYMIDGIPGLTDDEKMRLAAIFGVR